MSAGATRGSPAVGRGALVHSFFESSARSAAAAVLGLYEERLTDDDLDRRDSLIERAVSVGADYRGASRRETRRSIEEN